MKTLDLASWRNWRPWRETFQWRRRQDSKRSGLRKRARQLLSRGAMKSEENEVLAWPLPPSPAVPGDGDTARVRTPQGSVLCCFPLNLWPPSHWSLSVHRHLRCTASPPRPLTPGPQARPSVRPHRLQFQSGHDAPLRRPGPALLLPPGRWGGGLSAPSPGEVASGDIPSSLSGGISASVTCLLTAWPFPTRTRDASATPQGPTTGVWTPAGTGGTAGPLTISGPTVLRPWMLPFPGMTSSI